MADHLSTIAKIMKKSLPSAETSSWCGVAVWLTLILLASSTSENYSDQEYSDAGGAGAGASLRQQRPCDEIYVVREGETLHTISDKCGDPFIVEHNPHIHDPDDVFPGLVIKITPNPTH